MLVDVDGGVHGRLLAGVEVVVEGREHGLVVGVVAVVVLEGGLIILDRILLIRPDWSLTGYNVGMTTGVEVRVVLAPGHAGGVWIHAGPEGKFIVLEMLLVLVVYCWIFVVL